MKKLCILLVGAGAIALASCSSSSCCGKSQCGGAGAQACTKCPTGQCACGVK